MSRVNKIIDLLEDKSNLYGAEIGVYKGESSKALCDNLDIEKLYLIDPYEAYNDDPGVYSDDKITRAKKEATSKLSDFSEIIEFIEKDSLEAHNDINDWLDFVFIDGNHTQAYCYEDIKNYYRHVKDGGLVSGDDFRPQLDNRVADAVRKFCHERDIHYEIDGVTWWFWK